MTVSGHGALKSGNLVQRPSLPPRPEQLLTGTKARRLGVDPDALNRLVKRANETKSLGLVVRVDGTTAAERYFGAPQEPLPIMSITKPIIGILILKLIESGKLRSLDQLASDFYPLWKSDPRRARISLRHLLTHTSGIKTTAQPNNNAFADIVAFSLAQPMATAPGTTWEYNNFAFYILGDILRRASSKRADDLAKELLFGPLGITEFSWRTDGAKGADTAGGLTLHAHDLAKIAELILKNGVYSGRRILTEKSAHEMLTLQTRGGPGKVNVPDSPTIGLVWMLAPMPGRIFNATLAGNWRRAGVLEANLRKMMPYRDRALPEQDYEAILRSLFRISNIEDPDAAQPLLGARKPVDLYVETTPQIFAFSHSGSAGQYLVGLPTRRLAAARLVGLGKAYSENAPEGYEEFENDVYRLVRGMLPSVL